MVCLLPTLSLKRPAAAVLANTPTVSGTRRPANSRALARWSRRSIAALSSRYQLPCYEAATPSTADIYGVAHLFLERTAASRAGRRRTDEASRPDRANLLPGHPASFVRLV